MFSEKEQITALRKTPLFSGWKDEFLKNIVKNSAIDLYEKGSVIFDEKQIGDRFYLILDGTVVIRSAEDKTALAEFVSGEIFGETALITKQNQNAIASAEHKTHILSFPKDGKAIPSVLKDQPSTYALLLRSFLITVSKRTRKANCLIKENSPIMQELQKQVYADKLTGLLNKAYLEENIASFMKSKFSLIMMKPDNFKTINDNYGHEKGDECLTFVGGHLSQFLDTDSILVRYAGNEFAVLTPEQDKAKANELANKIKDYLENLDLSSIIDGDLKLSMSLGILLYPDTEIEKDNFIKFCSEMPLVGRANGGSQILFETDEKIQAKIEEEKNTEAK
ncbi:MAG: diguanylate cyclase [Treponema sp.]|nr:MAG: diguanylate cyclase [Treponema sp.]